MWSGNFGLCGNETPSAGNGFDSLLSGNSTPLTAVRPSEIIPCSEEEVEICEQSYARNAKVKESTQGGGHSK